MRAARHYSIDPAEVQFKELNKRHGFLRIRRKVVIEVDPENPKRSSVAAAAAPKGVETAKPEAPTPPASQREVSRPPAPKTDTPVAATPKPDTPVTATPTSGSDSRVKSSPPRREKREELARGVNQEAEAATDGLLVGLPDRPRSVRERYPEATGTTALAAEKALKVALELLAMDAKIDVRQGDGQLEIELSADDQSRLLDDDGRVLAALQHLVPRLIRGFIGEGVMCRLDCDNYHQIREEQLRDMAQKAADEVKQQGRAWSLKPMPPEERRVIHLTLKDDSTVKTDSVGDGFFKRVRVRPA